MWCQELKSQKGRHSDSNRGTKIIETQAEMKESEVIHKVIMQAAIQPAMVVVMVMREADSGPTSSGNVVS